LSCKTLAKCCIPFSSICLEDRSNVVRVCVNEKHALNCKRLSIVKMNCGRIAQYCNLIFNIDWYFIKLMFVPLHFSSLIERFASIYHQLLQQFVFKNILLFFKSLWELFILDCLFDQSTYQNRMLWIVLEGASLTMKLRLFSSSVWFMFSSINSFSDNYIRAPNRRRRKLQK